MNYLYVVERQFGGDEAGFRYGETTEERLGRHCLAPLVADERYLMAKSQMRSGKCHAAAHSDPDGLQTHTQTKRVARCRYWKQLNP